MSQKMKDIWITGLWINWIEIFLVDPWHIIKALTKFLVDLLKGSWKSWDALLVLAYIFTSFFWSGLLKIGDFLE